MGTDGTDGTDATPVRNPVVARVRRLGRPLRRVARDVGRRVDERRNPMLGWLRAGQRARPSPPELWDDMWENRRRLVRSLAPGRSFLDLGGMFGIDGELAFVAEEAGATSVTLFDAMDPSDTFATTHAARGSRIDFVQGDFHDPDVVAWLGRFDVVWCTGVIYHSPNPMQQLRYLRQLTTSQLVLGTHVLPEIPGIEQLSMLYPGVKEGTRDVFAAVFGGPERLPGMASPFDTTPLMAYANMWWGFSPSAVRSMLHYSGFTITEEHEYGPFWLDCVTNVGGQPTDIYPPLDQSRERVRRRHADTSDERLPPWAQRQVRDIRSASAHEGGDA